MFNTLLVNWFHFRRQRYFLLQCEFLESFVLPMQGFNFLPNLPVVFCQFLGFRKFSDFFLLKLVFLFDSLNSAAETTIKK